MQYGRPTIRGAARTGESMLDDADKRGIETVHKAAKSLPYSVQYLRNHQVKMSTTELSNTLGRKPETIRAEMHSQCPHRVKKLPGKQHGPIAEDVWQYIPTGSEIPWREEYRTD